MTLETFLYILLIEYPNLSNSTIIRGYPLIHEKICDMYENCSEYIFNIIHEVDYSKDILDLLESKLKKEIINLLLKLSFRNLQ